MNIEKVNLATISAIRSCIGKNVSSIARIQYYFNNVEDDDGYGDLEIIYNDSSYLTLSGIGDAESIKAHNQKAIIPETFHVTENDIASWKRIDLSKNEDWLKVIGQTLNKANVIWNTYNHTEGKLTACVLFFENDYISFYETNSDTNKFYINKPVPSTEAQTRIEIV